MVVSNFKTADTITRPKRFAPWKIRFRRSLFTIPSTKNIGAREIFREPRRVTSFVTRHRRRGGRGEGREAVEHGEITAVKLDTHYNPIKSPRWVRHRQSDRSLCQFDPSTPPLQGARLYTRSRSRDIEKFASDLFKHRFIRSSKKADKRVTIIGRGALPIDLTRFSTPPLSVNIRRREKISRWRRRGRRRSLKSNHQFLLTPRSRNSISFPDLNRDFANRSKVRRIEGWIRRHPTNWTGWNSMDRQIWRIR